MRELKAKKEATAGADDSVSSSIARLGRATVREHLKGQ